MSEEHTERLEAALDGKYRIERKLGEGGMASVYLAEDIKHKRKVALKILRPELAAVLGAERFLAEIQTTANLQHPHILALFDSGEAEGYLYYVMPYIDGETLREKLDREKQLGVEEAVRIARDVADALDYAHRAGVIHRDIKPGNILLHDGRPVVADFGIALAVSAAGGGRMTETGLSLGTPHYMSPEQASADRDLSARSDVYSLGCVLYEMIAGQPPHTGPSAQSILVRIMTKEATPLSDLRHTVPSHVAATVAKAIEKLPADRFETAKQFMDALGDEGFTHQIGGAMALAPAQPLGTPSTGLPTTRVYKAASALLAATTFVFGWMALGSGEGQATASGGVVSFVLTDELDDRRPPIVAEDGSIAFHQAGGLSLLTPGTVSPTPLEGTEGTLSATFSPDGERLAFVQAMNQGGYALRSMPARGGPVRMLWEGDSDGGLYGMGSPAWSEDGWIYLSTAEAVGRVPEEGGALDTLIALTDGRVTRITAIPGAQGIAFTLGRGDADPDNRVVLLDLATSDTTTLIRDGFDARWVSSGHLVYAASGGALYAAPFDPGSLEVTGPAMPVLDEASVAGNLWGRFDVSANGTLVYAQGPTVGFGTGGGVGGAFAFALVDLNGNIEVLPLEPTDHPDVAPSPDGTRLVYTRRDQIWLYDIDSGLNRPLTEEGYNQHNPVWSPDGSAVAFGANRGEDQIAALYVLPVDGSEGPRRVGDTPGHDFPTQWLEDGTILTFGLGQFADIHRMSASGDTPPQTVLAADWVEGNAKVSPDGSLLAYVSSEDQERAHIFLRRWPDLSGKTQVTVGQVPVRIEVSNALAWGADSRTIYFQRDFRLWTALLGGADRTDIQLSDTGIDLPGYLWETMSDGRLLFFTEQASAEQGGDAVPPRLVVVANWLSMLRERVGDN